MSYGYVSAMRARCPARSRANMKWVRLLSDVMTVGVGSPFRFSLQPSPYGLDSGVPLHAAVQAVWANQWECTVTQAVDRIIRYRFQSSQVHYLKITTCTMLINLFARMSSVQGLRVCDLVRRFFLTRMTQLHIT